MLWGASIDPRDPGPSAWKRLDCRTWDWTSLHACRRTSLPWWWWCPRRPICRFLCQPFEGLGLVFIARTVLYHVRLQVLTGLPVWFGPLCSEQNRVSLTGSEVSVQCWSRSHRRRKALSFSGKRTSNTRANCLILFNLHKAYHSYSNEQTAQSHAFKRHELNLISIILPLKLGHGAP